MKLNKTIKRRIEHLHNEARLWLAIWQNSRLECHFRAAERCLHVAKLIYNDYYINSTDVIDMNIYLKKVG
jgi:GH35 family endo-1,4-beta-xylanase